MYAIKGGQQECVKLFLENSADANHVYNGENAVDAAKISPCDNVNHSICILSADDALKAERNGNIYDKKNKNTFCMYMYNIECIF